MKNGFRRIDISGKPYFIQRDIYADYALPSDGGLTVTPAPFRKTDTIRFDPAEFPVLGGGTEIQVTWRGRDGKILRQATVPRQKEFELEINDKAFSWQLKGIE